MKTIRIEYIAPELSHFYGDHANLLYLSKKAELMGNHVEIIPTHLNDIPAFVDLTECPDMIYIGPTTEHAQTVLIKTLLKYKNELHDVIEEGTLVLTTGNSLEIYYNNIISEDKTSIKPLGFFELESERFSGKRYSVNVIGEYEDQKIAGYKNLLCRTITQNNPYPLFKVVKEAGELQEDTWEGIHYQNLYATYLLGPILLQNPMFSNIILHQLFGEAYKEIYLPFELEAHNKRVHDVMTDKNPDKNG